ncbi:MAG: hypothetical protein SGPRY_000749, partial [Prymnesium sp.]
VSVRWVASRAFMSKRQRATAEAHVWQPRKLALSLDSGQPAEVSWALETLLLASCPPDSSTVPDRLEPLVSFPRNPSLLRALLPHALPPPPGPEASPLLPIPPAHVTALRLRRLQQQQAWLLLRNASLMPENEAPLALSQPLRRLLFYTLRSALQEHERQPALTPRDVQLQDASEMGLCSSDTEATLLADMPTQCALNPLCVRGFRHGGRGGPCKVVPPAAHSSILARQAERAVVTRATTHEYAERSRIMHGGETCNPILSGGSGPPLLSNAFDASVHGYAAEVFSTVCRQANCLCSPLRSSCPQYLSALIIGPPSGPPNLFSPFDAIPGVPCAQVKLDEWGERVHLPGDSPCTPAVLTELLSSLLRCGEVSLVLPAIESFGRLAMIEENEVHLLRMIETEPVLISVLSNALSGQLEAPQGRELQHFMWTITTTMTRDWDAMNGISSRFGVSPASPYNILTGTLEVEESLLARILVDVAKRNTILSCWAEGITLLDISLAPRHLLALGTPPLFRRPIARREAPTCVRSVCELLLPETNRSSERWLKATQENLTEMGPRILVESQLFDPSHIAANLNEAAVNELSDTFPSIEALKDQLINQIMLDFWQRVFSLLEAMFGKNRNAALSDMNQAGLMLRYSKRVVG